MEIVNLIVLNLEKVGIGVVLFLGAYLANMGLGAWKNVKIDGYDFDWKLIAKSGAKFTIRYIGDSINKIKQILGIGSEG